MNGCPLSNTSPAQVVELVGGRKRYKGIRNVCAFRESIFAASQKPVECLKNHFRLHALSESLHATRFYRCG